MEETSKIMAPTKIPIFEYEELEHNLKHRNISDPENQGRTGFHQALISGASLHSIKIFTDNGADLKLKDNRKEGALHFAVRGGNLQVIKYLISLNLNINKVDYLGQTPLHKVAHLRSGGDYLELTKMLLENGANLLAKDNYGDTLAHLLAISDNISSNDFEIWVKGMIDIGKGHICGERGFCGRTPLQAAIQNREIDKSTIKMLLELSEMDINERDEEGATILELALIYGRSLRIIQSLIEFGANVNLKFKNGSGMPHAAVIGGNMDVIKYLIEQEGLEVNEANDFGDAPLHCVPETRLKNYFEMTQFLVNNGANLYAMNKKGNTVAHKLCLWEGLKCEDLKIWARAMIGNGYADLFAIRGEFGRNPLSYMMQRMDLNVDLETIRLIVESAKLDINELDDEGNTILDLALSFGRNLETIKGLVELGADWKRKRINGCSVLHFCVQEGNKEAFVYFKSLGADVNVKDERGQTPLHYVRWTENGNFLELTKFLLENGADVNARDVFGRTLDELMSDWLGDEEYDVWKEGMIELGYASLFD